MSARGRTQARGWAGIAVLLAGVAIGAGKAWAQESAPAAMEESSDMPKGESRMALSIGNEMSVAAGARNDSPSVSNLGLVQLSVAHRNGERWRVASSVAGLLDTYDRTRGRLRVRETYGSLSVGDWDLAVGKKLLRWGTGFAFTPSGILDPPRRPTDPTDRLSLNEGRELVMANWVRGRHSVTAAWASAGLLERSRPGMYDTAALRYNALVAGFDTSLLYAHLRGSVDFWGVNFTNVVGSRIEVHGEAALRAGDERIAVPGLSEPLPLADTSRVAVLLGGKYTPHTGVTAIIELYSTDGLIAVTGAVPAGFAADGQSSLRLPTERRHYALATLSMSRLRELPGWKDWDLSVTALASLSDGSLIALLDVERRLGLRYAAHLRVTTPAGARGRSEYGMIPYAAQVSIGLRCQL